MGCLAPKQADDSEQESGKSSDVGPVFRDGAPVKAMGVEEPWEVWAGPRLAAKCSALQEKGPPIQCKVKYVQPKRREPVPPEQTAHYLDLQQHPRPEQPPEKKLNTLKKNEEERLDGTPRSQQSDTISCISSGAIGAALQVLEAADYNAAKFSSDSSSEDEVIATHDSTRHGHNNFPQVDVSLATRLLLLTWARWGRNSLRIKQEERLKVLQHAHYRRRTRRTPSPTLSPQPSPRKQVSSMLQEEPLKPPTPTRARTTGDWRAKSSTTTSRKSIRPSTLFDTLLQDQRASMEAQAIKSNLQAKLGPHSTKANSTGTPGFGLETPNFPEVKTGTATASIMSSGVASPLASGQLSPWLLEAEACVDTDVDKAHPDFMDLSKKKITNAWQEPPSPIHDITTSTWAPSEDLPTILDEDELQQVEKFVDKQASFRNPSPEKHIIDMDLEVTDADIFHENTCFEAAPKVDVEKREKDHHLNERQQVVKDKHGEKGKKVPACSGPHGYSVGESVTYWSSTKSCWLPAKIVEKKSPKVYVIDKQMQGCFAKVKATDLISEAETRKDKVLAALSQLETDSQSSKPKQPSSRSLPPLRVRSKSPIARKPHGTIVRDDFSDDSDN